jgi:hypothetical protein
MGSTVKPPAGSDYRVYRYNGVGYGGKNPAFVDVTDNVVEQAHINPENLNFAVKAAGKEGAKGEYDTKRKTEFNLGNIEEFNKYIR